MIASILPEKAIFEKQKDSKGKKKIGLEAIGSRPHFRVQAGEMQCYMSRCDW
jgi:hypothetical protein